MDELQGNKRTPLSVFISYAHEDAPLLQRLETHLSLLRRQELISEWHDRQILPGDEWAHEIDARLETASIILLLISPDFLASDYCYDIEMQRALERHKRREVRVIPIILRPCDWRTSPFAHLQCLPRDGKAITAWQNPDEAFLVIVQGLRLVIEQQQIPIHPLPDVVRQNRMRLLKRVRATWIEEVLKRSLHHAALIALDLQEQPDALANPWQHEVQETKLPPRPFPAGTSIVQVYDEAEGELLILGEPGAGKTTLLLELARTLLQRAEEGERHRLPVVFHLSSWAQGRQSLAVWLVEELWIKYQVSPPIGKALIDSDQVLPLLDGLDEVAESVRAACVQAINAYYQSHLEKKEAAPLVVCCRSKEYTTLPTQVTLQRAISIQPLTDEQIERYIQSAKGQLEELRHALHTDRELYELAQRPLMLSIFTLAYQRAGSQELPTEGTREAQQRQVFATYVERMLSHGGVFKHASREQMLRWLAFLASQMQLHQQTLFFLERMQFDWLPAEQSRRLTLTVVLLFKLLIGMGTGLAGLLFFHQPIVGLIFGLVGIYLAKPDLVNGEIEPAEKISWSWAGVKHNLVDSLFTGFKIGLFIVLLTILFSIMSILLFFLLPTFKIFGNFPLSYLLTAVIMIMLGGGLLLVIQSGWTTEMLDERLLIRPNQGIWRSGRHGLIIGLIFAGVGILTFTFLPDPVEGFLANPLNGLVCGCILGFVAGLLNGGMACIKHALLCRSLWRAGEIPRKYSHFLDYGAEHLVLHKVGGGYLFVHRLLLEYFASLHSPLFSHSKEKQV